MKGEQTQQVQQRGLLQGQPYIKITTFPAKPFHSCTQDRVAQSQAPSASLKIHGQGTPASQGPNLGHIPCCRKGEAGKAVALPATLALKILALLPSIISITLKNDPNNSSSMIKRI